MSSVSLWLSSTLFALSPAEAAATDIVITGKGLDAPPGEVTLAVAEIDRSRLTDSGSVRLEELLRDVAGVAQFRRADARSAHPTAQGISLRGLGGNASSRALLLLDGVPQADPFGGWVPFPALMPHRLDRVRVTRGGGSGYHGPGALAGTVELFSVDADTIGPAVASASYGSNNALDLSAAGGTHLGTGQVTWAGQFARGDGFIPIAEAHRGLVDRAAPYKQAGLSTRALVPVASDITLQASLSGFYDARDRGTDFTPSTSKGADASLRLIGSGATPWAVTTWLQHRDFASGFASINATRTTVSPSLEQSVPASGHGLRLEVEPNIAPNFTLRVGGDLRAVSGSSRELYSYTAGEPTRRRIAGGRSVTRGAFIDASQIAGDWTLTAGGRIDHWAIRDGQLVESLLTGGPLLTDVAHDDRSGWEWSGRLGVAYGIGDNVTLRSAAYRGWRLPTLNELYRPFRAGSDATAANPLLNPERMQGVELGVDLTPAGGLTLSATGFANRMTDAIANVTLGAGPGNFPGVGFVAAGGAYRMRQNLDAITVRGAELDLNYVTGPWRAGLSYAYSDAQVSAQGVASPLDDRRPAQVAPHHASAHLAYHAAPFTLSTTVRYTAAQFEDDLNARSLSDALTLDAALHVPLSRNFTLSLRGENLTDTEVETAISNSGVIERASPRTLWIGLSIKP